MPTHPFSDDARPVPSPRSDAHAVEAPHAWLLITGDPVSGFSFYGPFPTRSAAEDARDERAINLRRDAVVAKLYEP